MWADIFPSLREYRKLKQTEQKRTEQITIETGQSKPEQIEIETK